MSLSQMTRAEPRLGLFARTFLLLALLMLASLGAWLHVFYTLELEPRAERSAAELVRSVQVSRAALLNAPSQQREATRQAIDAQPNVQLRLASPSDQTVGLDQDQYWQAVRESVRTGLAADLTMAAALNGENSLWIQFPLQGQAYWMGVDIDQTYLTTGPEWVSWVAAAALLSLIGAAVAVGYMNRPLARLSRAAQQLSRGQTPSPLPETGAIEIRELNASFNRMVTELEHAQNDRNLMLAGISHDLRTPLARMRLEIEMSLMSDEQRRAIDQDLSQVDRTIGQLLEYARPARQLPDKPIDVTTVVQGLVQEEQAHAKGGDLILSLKTGGAIYCLMDQRDFARCLVNLIENARRYGVRGNEPSSIEINVQTRNNRIYVDVKDRGPGIAAQDVARVMRPFSRGDMARTGGTGAGLGLSIVERLLSPASGRLRLLPREGGGLIARLDLPRARRGQRVSDLTAISRPVVRLRRPS